MLTVVFVSSNRNLGLNGHKGLTIPSLLIILQGVKIDSPWHSTRLREPSWIYDSPLGKESLTWSSSSHSILGHFPGGPQQKGRILNRNFSDQERRKCHFKILKIKLSSKNSTPDRTVHQMWETDKNSPRHQKNK